MTRLPLVLSAHDLPVAELCAARLDGEVFALDACFCPVDELEASAHRGAALAAVLPDRVIAEQRSAAWIWGAIEQPPAQHELCASVESRVRPAAATHICVREVVIEQIDLSWIGGMRVTTPLRTAVDLARFSVHFDATERHIVRRLMELGDFGLTECLRDMDRRRNLPNKRRAASRLRACLS